MSEIVKNDIQQVLSTAFLNYAGYNLQRRAIPDSRDGLKWGARQLLHAQMLGKLTYDKPFKKAIKSVSQAMGFSYVHGDASAYSTFIRMAKPFAYRVPLQEANGNYGTLIDPDDHSAPRYVELRGSEIAALLLKDLNKDTITEWEDTYDLEGKFPKVLPSKGFYNVVNGCISIGSGMSCSIPPTNLKEVNQAIITLINNPDCDFEDICCLPDFPTGGTILNKNEVIDSMKNGNGKACIVRSVVDYDEENNCLVVTELPYSTYTNTICKQIAKIINEDPECGIDDIKDYTKQKVDLRIYLKKKANPYMVLKRLYKDTSLQNFYSINMVMLDNGVTPRTFTWREMLQSYIDHQRIVYRRGFEFDLAKIEKRIHIIDGLLKCLANIEEVIKTIKQSSNTEDAKNKLIANFLLDDVQAKAVLEMKLSRLAHLEVEKLKNEKADFVEKANKIKDILENKDKLDNEIKKDLQTVIDKYGDERRTELINLQVDDEDEPIEEKTFVLYLTNKGSIIAKENSTLVTQKRGGKGSKLKLANNEIIVDTDIEKNNSNCLFFTNKGKVYSMLINNIPLDKKSNPNSFFDFEDGEYVTNIYGCSKINKQSFIVFVTKNGLIKKTEMSEYKIKKTKGIKAIKLKDDDEIASILFVKNEKVGLLTKGGNFSIINTKDINPVGRVTMGVKGITLNKDDYVISAKVIPDAAEHIVSITEKGLIKKTAIKEFTIHNRGAKGVIIQKLKENDFMADFNYLTFLDNNDIMIISNKGSICIPVNQIPETTRVATGVISKKLTTNEVIKKVVKNLF